MPLLYRLIGNPRVILATMALVTFLGATGYAYWLGRTHEANAHLQEMLDLREAQLEALERANDAEAARLELERQRNELVRRLEDEARADPTAGGVGLAERVMRRLGQR